MKTLRTPEDIIGYKLVFDQYTFTTERIKSIILTAQREALEAVVEVAKTKKTGNSGSWYDASVDKDSILKLMPKI